MTEPAENKAPQPLFQMYEVSTFSWTTTAIALFSL